MSGSEAEDGGDTGANTGDTGANSGADLVPIGVGRGLCSVCGKPAPNRCGRCLAALYCSRDCRESNRRDHKKPCDASVANGAVNGFAEAEASVIRAVQRFAPSIGSLVRSGFTTYRPGDIVAFYERTAEQYERLEKLKSFRPTDFPFSFAAWNDGSVTGLSYAPSVLSYVRGIWGDEPPPWPTVVYSAVVKVGPARYLVVRHLSV